MYTCEKCNKEFEKYGPFSTHCNRKHKIAYSELKEKYFPKKELEFKCNRCSDSFNTYDSLRRHTGKIHKIESQEFYVEFYLNGIWPMCKCGCNTKVKWDNRLKNFCNYIAGHQSRVYNNWGHNEIAKFKSAETRRKQYASGERKVWNDGLTKETNAIVAKLGEMSKKENNPERAKKISNALIGIPKSAAHLEKNTKHWQEYWSNEANRDAQRLRRMEYMKNFLRKEETKLEKKFKLLLDASGIKYEFQYDIEGYNFDFFIIGTKLLIEADGDFWHCHPNKWPEPIYESQKHTLEHDKVKNNIAKSNGYTLLRFWESDIKENPAKVMKTLLNALPI